MDDDALNPALKNGDWAEALFRIYELRFSSIVRRSMRLLRRELGTTLMLRRASVGVVTKVLCFRAAGDCANAEGAIEKMLVHLVVYELVLIGRRIDEKFVLLREGE